MVVGLLASGIEAVTSDWDLGGPVNMNLLAGERDRGWGGGLGKIYFGGIPIRASALLTATWVDLGLMREFAPNLSEGEQAQTGCAAPALDLGRPTRLTNVLSGSFRSQALTSVARRDRGENESLILHSIASPSLCLESGSREIFKTVRLGAAFMTTESRFGAGNWMSKNKIQA